MKECDKRNSHISSKLHMIYIYSNNDKHPATKTFTPLHYPFRHFTSSHSNFTQLHFTTLSFRLTPFQFPTAPFHLTSLHFTALHFSPHFCSFHFAPFVIAFLTLYLKKKNWIGKDSEGIGRGQIWVLSWSCRGRRSLWKIVIVEAHPTGIETRLWADRSGVWIPLGWADSRPALAPCGYSGSFPRLPRPGREAYHSPPSSSEVKNEWSCTSTPPPIWLHGVDWENVNLTGDNMWH